MSKIERGERRTKKEHVAILCQVLKADEDELMTIWLADQVMDVIKNEPCANQVIKSVTEKIEKSE